MSEVNINLASVESGETKIFRQVCRYEVGRQAETQRETERERERERDSKMT